MDMDMAILLAKAMAMGKQKIRRKEGKKRIKRAFPSSYKGLADNSVVLYRYKINLCAFTQDHTL